MATKELNGYDGDPELPGYGLTGAQHLPNIIDLYWKVHPTSVAVAVDSIRTSLVGVVAEL